MSKLIDNPHLDVHESEKERLFACLLRNSFDWKSSIEGYNYWQSWYEILLTLGKRINQAGYKTVVVDLNTQTPALESHIFSNHKENPQYPIFKVIAKYYERFGNLPSADLLKELYSGSSSE